MTGLRRLSAAVGVIGLVSSAGLAAPTCVSDITGNCTVNIDDINAFAGGFVNMGAESDLDGNGEWNLDDIVIFAEAYVAESPDPDGDRLSACAEAYYQTDPNNPDTDGDGLTDADETIGTDTGLNLQQLGANPVRKTIFVETDWFEGTFQGSALNFRPTAAMVTAIKAPFTNAPVSNPDGSFGIDMIIDYGQGGVFTGGNKLPGEPDFISFDGDFNTYKAAHFAAQRKGYFHYCIFANRYDSATNGSSGIAEISGDDFMVTLYTFFNTFNGATTFVHEIGHNLGLRHGGNENKNYKPNYNSIMNYRYQFPGADTNGNAVGDGVIDYSIGFNVQLDETALMEDQGVTGENPIDWDGDTMIDAAAVMRNVNCPAGTTNPCGTQGACDDGVCNTLTDHDDWDAITWNRLIGGDRVPAWNLIECDNWPGK